MTTYFVSDERMLLHRNEWDDTHIEKPERLASILKILQNNQVLKQCTILDAKKASLEDVCLVHNKKYVEEIRQTKHWSKVLFRIFEARLIKTTFITFN